MRRLRHGWDWLYVPSKTICKQRTTWPESNQKQRYPESLWLSCSLTSCILAFVLCLGCTSSSPTQTQKTSIPTSQSNEGNGSSSLLTTTGNQKTLLCAKRCVLGAPSSQPDSCANHPTYSQQTVNGKTCAWTYPPLPPMKRSEHPW